MAIYKEDIATINLEGGNIFRSFKKHTIGMADSAADRFGIRVMRGDTEVDLSGCSCYAYFQNSQGENIALTSYGTIDGNVAYVTLPQACYNYEGQFCLAIKLIGGGVTGTMRIVDGVVDNTNTGSAVAPTGAVPTYQEILSQYDAMVAATAAANGCTAVTFDATKAYSAGKYVINNGALYRLTADHAANTTWANTYKEAVKFGDEITEVKTAFNRYTDYEKLEAWNAGHYYANGPSVTTVDSTSPASNSNYSCMVLQCSPGDVFEYFGESSNTARSISFLSSASGTGNKLTSSGYQYSTGTKVSAPANAAYVIFNKKNSVPCSIVKYKKIHNLLSGDNLDNCTSEGVYICSSSAIAAEISGRPSTMGSIAFRMDVQKVRITDNYIRQILTTVTGASSDYSIYLREFTTISGDWVLIYNGGQIPLEIKKLKLIENGTDLNDLLTPGSYYCPSYSVAATLENLPFFVDSGFSMYVVNSGAPSTVDSYIRQIIFANKKEFSTIYTRTLNLVWGEWQVMASADMVLQPYTMAESEFVPGARLQGTPKKTITVATNNVAHYWLQGAATDDFLADHPIKIDNWRKLLMKTAADIIFLQECEDYIDEDRTISAFDTLYAPFFDSDHNIDDQGTERPDKTGRAHPSRRKILNRLGLNTEGTAVTVEPVDQTYQYDCYYSWCIVNLSGVGDLLLIDLHNFAGKSAARVTDRANYLDELAAFIGTKTYDYLIIAGDTNVTNTESDYGNLLDFCEEIDAIPVNGGIIGWIGTANLEELPRPFDNIIVSNNIRIEDINCDPMLIPSGQLHTDHTLISAKISFM